MNIKHKIGMLTYLYNVNNTDYLKYHQLIASIPNTIKDKMKNEIPINIPTNTLKQKLSKSKIKANKVLYSIQLNSIEINDQSLTEKWRNKLHTNIENIPWKVIYKTQIKSTNDVSLRNFQYKYVNRIVPTNKYLYRCKLVNSNLCDFCQEHIETHEHLFWECRKIQDMWSQLKSLLELNNNNIILNYQNISFGYDEQIECKLIINYLILVMKFFIHSMKCRNSIPNFASFLNYVVLKEKIERETAILYNKMNYHEQKWNRINRYISNT